MEGVAALARWGAYGFAITFLLTFVYKMLIGTISLDGLLTGVNKEGQEYLSVGRTQLVVLTLVSAAIYVRQVVTSSDWSTLPPAPEAMVAIMGGSQLFYLTGKARALILGPSGRSSRKGS